MHLTW